MYMFVFQKQLLSTVKYTAYMLVFLLGSTLPKNHLTIVRMLNKSGHMVPTVLLIDLKLTKNGVSVKNVFIPIAT